MAFFVSQRFSDASDAIQELMQIIIIFVIPSLAMSLLVILAPVFCCCCCLGDKCACLHKRVIGVAQHIFCFLEKKGSRFVLFGYRAPVCYTYYLLFLASILCIHTFFTFWDNLFYVPFLGIAEDRKPIYRYIYCIDIFNVTEKAVPLYNDTVNLTCIELDPLNAVEDAATTFGLSALAVAIITWLLLGCSKGNRARTQMTPRLLCIPLIMIFQIIGLVVPRVIFLVYLDHIASTWKYPGFWLYDDILDPPIPAVTDEGSLFAVIAIFDAISLSMLTPWLCFEKQESESEEGGNVTSPVLKANNQTFEMV